MKMNNITFNCLVAPNSFKECVEAVDIAKFIKLTLRNYLPSEIREQINFDLIPISDGGDGFLQVCKNNFDLEILEYEISYPYNEETFFCPVGYSFENKTIYIESAEILGMKLIPKEHRDPMNLSSKGLGDLLIQIVDSIENDNLQVDKIIIGIGGTGINDLGLGMLKTIGWKFFDENKNEIVPIPANFMKIKGFEGEKIETPFKVELVVDVDNPLIGDQGASKVFSLQKGATLKEAEEMDKGFQEVLSVLGIPEKKIDLLNGSGGGLTAAFELFFDVNIKLGNEFILDDLKLKDTQNKIYNLVITGEGKQDYKSYMNKGAMLVVNAFKEKDIPIYFICGQSEDDLPEVPNLHVLDLSEYFNSEEESILNIDKGIELVTKKIAKEIINQFKQRK